MTDDHRYWLRLAVLGKLVRDAPSPPLGRTAIMKLAYFLQVLRGVGLGYNFRLYTYGPFDSGVLDDLAQAETLDVISSKRVDKQDSYGYEFSAGESQPFVEKRAGGDWEVVSREVDWVLDRFGHCAVSELELLSTIVYIDRETVRSSDQITRAKLQERAREIKPRFDLPEIDSAIDRLRDDALLQATTP